MKLNELLQPNLINLNMSASGKMDALRELGKMLSRVSDNIDPVVVVEALVEREKLATTGIGEGIAIPHAKLVCFPENTIAIGISRIGIDFDSIDDKPVSIFIALIVPDNSKGDHLRLLAQISRILKVPEIKTRFINASTQEEIISIIREEEAKQ